MTTPTPQEEGWRERFRERFCDKFGGYPDAYWKTRHVPAEEVEAFIQEEIEKAESRACAALLREIREGIKRMKVKDTFQNGLGNWTSIRLRSNDVARNVTLEAVLEFLDSQEKR